MRSLRSLRSSGVQLRKKSTARNKGVGKELAGKKSGEGRNALGKKGLLEWASTVVCFTVKHFEELKDGQVMLRLLHTIWPNIVKPLAKDCMFERGSRFNWEIDAAWNAFRAICRQLELPLSSFPVEELRRGSWKACYHALVMLFFLHGLQRDHNLQAEFAHPIDFKLSEFLQSAKCVESLSKSKRLDRRRRQHKSLPRQAHHRSLHGGAQLPASSSPLDGERCSSFEAFGDYDGKRETTSTDEEDGGAFVVITEPPVAGSSLALGAPGVNLKFTLSPSRNSSHDAPGSGYSSSTIFVNPYCDELANYSRQSLSLAGNAAALSSSSFRMRPPESTLLPACATIGTFASRAKERPPAKKLPPRRLKITLGGGTRRRGNKKKGRRVHDDEVAGPEKAKEQEEKDVKEGYWKAIAEQLENELRELRGRAKDRERFLLETQEHERQQCYHQRTELEQEIRELRATVAALKAEQGASLRRTMANEIRDIDGALRKEEEKIEKALMIARRKTNMIAAEEQHDGAGIFAHEEAVHLRQLVVTTRQRHFLALKRIKTQDIAIVQQAAQIRALRSGVRKELKQNEELREVYRSWVETWAPPLTFGATNEDLPTLNSSSALSSSSSPPPPALPGIIEGGSSNEHERRFVRDARARRELWRLAVICRENIEDHISRLRELKKRHITCFLGARITAKKVNCNGGEEGAVRVLPPPYDSKVGGKDKDDIVNVLAARKSLGEMFAVLEEKHDMAAALIEAAERGDDQALNNNDGNANRHRDDGGSHAGRSGGEKQRKTSKKHADNPFRELRRLVWQMRTALEIIKTRAPVTVRAEKVLEQNASLSVQLALLKGHAEHAEREAQRARSDLSEAIRVQSLSDEKRVMALHSQLKVPLPEINHPPVWNLIGCTRRIPEQELVRSQQRFEVRDRLWAQLVNHLKTKKKKGKPRQRQQKKRNEEGGQQEEGGENTPRTIPRTTSASREEEMQLDRRGGGSSSSSSSSRISSSGSAVIHGNDSKRLEERQQHHHHQHQEQQEEEFNDKLKSLERQLDLVVDHPSSSSSVSSLPAGRQMPSSSSSSGAPPAAAAVAAQDRLLSWIPDTNAARPRNPVSPRFADDKKEVLKEMYSWKAKAEALSTEEQRKHEETRATELSLLMLWKLHVELLQLNSSLVVTQRSGDPAAETTKRKTQPDQSPTAS
eukprot:jgi/Bigna1/82715/fgenesh1_pg.96_\